MLSLLPQSSTLQWILIDYCFVFRRFEAPSVEDKPLLKHYHHVCRVPSRRMRYGQNCMPKKQKTLRTPTYRSTRNGLHPDNRDVPIVNEPRLNGDRRQSRRAALALQLHGTPSGASLRSPMSFTHPQRRMWFSEWNPSYGTPRDIEGILLNLLYLINPLEVGFFMRLVFCK